jgi:hypothetical protein
MRQIFLKTTDNQIIEFETILTQYELDQEDPYGVDYRVECSSTLSVTEINEWWDYVDQLLLEHPTENFKSVWRIINNGTLYGLEN